MEQFRFAFLIMSGDYSKEKQHCDFDTPLCKSLIIGVDSLETACHVAKDLADSGQVNKIELCGAFGEAGAKRVSDFIGGALPIAYVCDLPL